MTLFLRKLTIACCIVFTASTGLADDFDNLAQNLVKIRAQVEELQTQLDLDKQDHKNELSSLTSQMTDLEVEKRRKSMVYEELKNKMVAMQETIDADHQSDDIRPQLLNVLAALKQHVDDGIPFKQTERIDMFSNLETRLNTGAVDSRKIANKIWALIEDEVRLSKENGLYQQTIVLEGENKLADIAKLGMMYLYFKTRDDQLGLARRQQGQWRYERVLDPVAQQQIETLFDTLKKQVRQGFFELPNPYNS
ncbi:MAG: DUF3450 domain-containing protein [Gammaproteobacteria bacterium]|nr:DUF3450 domain-containing protein [Gammaproteobacteria bacterium]